MPDHLEQYLQGLPPDIPDDITQHGRVALREFLRLSEEAVRPAETQIRQRYEAAKQEAEKTLAKKRDEIQARLNETRAAAEGEYRDELRRIESDYATALETLEAETKASRDRINDESDAAGQDARKTCEEDDWLADSIADAAKKKLHDEFWLIRKKEIPKGLRRLHAITERSVWILHEYEQEPPPDPEEPVLQVPEVGSDPIAAFRKQLEAFRDEYAAAQRYLYVLERLWTPRLAVGSRPYILLALCCAGTVGLMGDNCWAYGIEPNRAALDALFAYSHEQGLASRRLTVEELFHPSTMGLVDSVS